MIYMQYYTEDLRKIEFTPSSKTIGVGTQGKVYRIDDDKCIKIYDNNVVKYDPEIFKLFKGLSLEGYCKLYDLLYNSPFLDEVSGYTMKYYHIEVNNILNMPTEYTIYSFNILYNSIKILAENKIFAKDTIPANAILTKDNVILIDFDTCTKSVQSTESILEVNTNNILYLFRRLFEEGLKKMGKDIKDDNLSGYLDALFAYSKEPVKALKRRMAYTKTPMEVLPWKYRY